MERFNPLNATGMLCTPGVAESEGPLVRGTCFLFRFDNIALTAAHCIPENQNGLFVLFPMSNKEVKVLNVIPHPKADIAILKLDTHDDGRGYPDNAFWDCVSNYGLAEEVIAYGFPDAARDDGTTESQQRIFVGYFQRFFEYTHMPQEYKYIAGEMNIGVPIGLSGGPIFRRAAPVMLLGIATANHESYTIVDSITEVEDNGDKYKEESRKIIVYGIALLLDKVKPWLKENIPSREGMGWIG